MTGPGRNGRFHGLVDVDDQERRGGLLLVAVVANGAIVLLNLLDVFDGAPTWVWVLLLGVQFLVVFPPGGARSGRGVRERRARQGVPRQ